MLRARDGGLTWNPRRPTSVRGRRWRMYRPPLTVPTTVLLHIIVDRAPMPVLMPLRHHVGTKIGGRVEPQPFWAKRQNTASIAALNRDVLGRGLRHKRLFQWPSSEPQSETRAEEDKASFFVVRGIGVEARIRRRAVWGDSLGCAAPWPVPSVHRYRQQCASSGRPASPRIRARCAAWSPANEVGSGRGNGPDGMKYRAFIGAPKLYR